MKNSNSKLGRRGPGCHRARSGPDVPLTMGRAVAVTTAAALLIGIILGPIVADNHSRAADTSGTPEHLITVSGGVW